MGVRRSFESLNRRRNKGVWQGRRISRGEEAEKGEEEKLKRDQCEVSDKRIGSWY